ncbi:hypothetical protein [Streptomyces beigongshangae]|uniref:hypothetical protein n=1 Tax=Streptomyces beigongshangae TaxID=2841597 RepID=UPI0027E0F328|nr:hypothetical protein [Streptomyces sp. REN17]
MLSKLAALAAALLVLPLSPASAAAQHARAEHLPLAAAVHLLPTAAESRDGYRRTSFKHWVDADRDSCHTRSEVLISESRTEPAVEARCKVTAGTWYSYYDGATLTAPGGLDIDHMVPLAEAWDSGAHAWTAKRREAYANDLDAERSLVPETIVIDRGRVFVSAAFLAACESLGVSVQPAPPRSPTAKGAVERTFGSINSLFAQHVAGYTGSHVLARGEAVQDEARFSVAQLQELLDEWITACWQHRPHDGLRHPFLPRKALSPTEMWGALLGASGYVPLPLTGADYTELLPVRFHPVTGRGIRIHYRTYDHAVLNEHRGRPSPAGPGGKWEVHLNPHDVRQLYLRLSDGHLHEIPWIHREHVHAPMSETVWRHLRTTLERRAGREAHEVALAEAADQVLRRSRPLPGKAAAAALSTTAGSPAGTLPARHLAGDAGDAGDVGDSLDAVAALAPDDDDSRAGSTEVPSAARFALYDAFEEAEHW